jgi:hypothetical protein
MKPLHKEILKTVLPIIILILIFIFWGYLTPDPVPPAVDAVMTPQERAERACQGDPYYESCVRIVLENMEGNEEI